MVSTYCTAVGLLLRQHRCFRCVLLAPRTCVVPSTSYILPPTTSYSRHTVILGSSAGFSCSEDPIKLLPSGSLITSVNGNVSPEINARNLTTEKQAARTSGGTRRDRGAAGQGGRTIDRSNPREVREAQYQRAAGHPELRTTAVFTALGYRYCYLSSVKRRGRADTKV